MAHNHRDGTYDNEHAMLERLRACEGKEKLDRANAESRAAKIRKIERGSQCRAYECRHCKSWHIGHKREDIK